MAEKDKMVRDVENIDSLKEKLLTVSNEINAIKNSFSKSAEDLSRVQSMLGIGNLDEISSILEKFESKVVEAERQRMEAAEGAKRYSEELEKEKERLIKLWDAYKNQEEELSATEKRINEYEERARMAEASKKQLEDDMTARIGTLSEKLETYESKAAQADKYKQKCEEFDSVRSQMEKEVIELKKENTSRENMINDLNEKVSKYKDLEDYAEYKTKYQEVHAEYEKEKERLTKLYHLYEETDSECKRLKLENNNWQKWYNSNKEIFNKIFSTAPPALSTTESNTSPPIFPENPVDDPNARKPEKAKKRLKFRRE
jgi:chromosome segregation ATPase